ncbi:uncharacterized protein MELLADRAFT_123877 [Melampsora larici-populina 98AG31]|uniref:Secreted protein n=1 Tax=Melampsora larici-populina (strain 98AG31 / pathotype 3-4-7) TaxID=747676 RepID=F4RTR1_MELLP|nr:uncharacterized protein MELLADRAFT_123877 [Melampsora larici-populina 98AG31]EGG04051.1 secreted protein [Melampsora larici-populina 98AG31]
MFYKQTNPMIFLSLMFLLLGNLGSHVFANAGSIECNYSWETPTPINNNQHKCISEDAQGTRRIWFCKTCHRGDNKKPSAKDCVGPQKLTTNGSFDCPGGMSVNAYTSPNRPIFCFTSNAQYVQEVYKCKERHLNQQCPTDQCTEQKT